MADKTSICSDESITGISLFHNINAIANSNNSNTIKTRVYDEMKILTINKNLKII